MGATRIVFNLTEEEEFQYLVFRTTISLARISLLVLPAIILVVLSIAALAISKKISSKIKVILINILVADVVIEVYLGVITLLVPIQAALDADVTVWCRIMFYLNSVGSQAKVYLLCLYSIFVYVFIKYGVDKLKWKLILIVTVVPWILFSMWNQMVLYEEFGIVAFRGTCIANARTPLIISKIAISWIIDGCCFTITSVVFSILSCLYVKQKIIGVELTLTKAMLKNLVLMMIGTIVYFLGTALPLTGSLFFPTERVETGASLWRRAPLQLVYSLYYLPSLINPIIILIFLKPVRQSFLKIVCWCRRPQLREEAVMAGQTTSTSL